MRNAVKTNAVLIVAVAATLAAGSVQAALVRTFDFEGTDTGLTLTGAPVLSTDRSVTGSQSVKMPANSDYYANTIEMLPGLMDTNIGTVVMRLYIDSSEGTVDDNVQVEMIEDPDYRCIQTNYGWPDSGELGYRNFEEAEKNWQPTGKALATDAWYTVAIAFNGRIDEDRFFSIWAAQGTDVTPADLVVDQTEFLLGGFSFDRMIAHATFTNTPWYMDNVQIYDTYGEGIVTGGPPAGDLNDDGMVGSADLDLVRGNWGETVDPGCLSCGDPSGDGIVGSADLDIVRGNWGATAAAGAVPEPHALGLILAAAACIMRTRSRRES